VTASGHPVAGRHERRECSGDRGARGRLRAHLSAPSTTTHRNASFARQSDASDRRARGAPDARTGPRCAGPVRRRAGCNRLATASRRKRCFVSCFTRFIVGPRSIIAESTALRLGRIKGRVTQERDVFWWASRCHVANLAAAATRPGIDNPGDRRTGGRSAEPASTEAPVTRRSTRRSTALKSRSRTVPLHSCSNVASMSSGGARRGAPSDVPGCMRACGSGTSCGGGGEWRGWWW
jgi:hypothetical protein